MAPYQHRENTKESMASLQDAMFLALIAIFGILVFLFKSYLRPLIIMSTIPLGLFASYCGDIRGWQNVIRLLEIEFFDGFFGTWCLCNEQ